VLVLALFLASAGAARASDLYGKPLRGLSAVPLAEIAKSPERFREKPIRVEGTGADGSASQVTLSEGGEKLVVKTDGSFTLPAQLQGARVTAEGKLKGNELVASGVEVKR
jgi:hypothetical protein